MTGHELILIGGLTALASSLLRLVLLTVAIVGIKGVLIPKLLFRAVLLADIRTTISSVIGFVPSLLLGGIGTGAALIFARSLPLPEGHQHHLLIPAAAAIALAIPDNFAMVLPIAVCMLLTLALGIYNPPLLTEWVDGAIQFLQRTPDEV